MWRGLGLERNRKRNKPYMYGYSTETDQASSDLEKAATLITVQCAVAACASALPQDRDQGRPILRLSNVYVRSTLTDPVVIGPLSHSLSDNCTSLTLTVTARM